MTDNRETAYITGAASGIGKAVAELLVKKGIRVYLADRDAPGVQAVAEALNKTTPSIATSTPLDVTDWNLQAKAFAEAVSHFNGRIDHVYPIAGIGERRWLPESGPMTAGYRKPDLTVLDIDLTGALYTISLAIQQFRRQDVGANGFRGKIGCVASVCGFYCAPTLPVYTAAKHAITGFIRSYGKYLPSENITINAVSPNVVRTNISTGAFYDALEADGLLTPLHGVIETFESLLDGSERETSGEIFEIGPNYASEGQGAVRRAPAEYLDEGSRKVVELLEVRGRPLQIPN